MKNYAGVQDYDDVIEEELIEADIDVLFVEWLRDHGEVPTAITGQLGRWSFKRAWGYWVAEGPGIPPKVAEKLHEKCGKEVRVDGHCSCPTPKEMFGGFAVGHYHVDSQRRLNALATVIKNILEEK